jgi:predicted RNA-binding protein YlqC (UPF0109 family)
MREFIEFIAKRLVDHPDAVHVEENEQESKVILKLSVGENEVGKVIGRKGRTARALRTPLNAVAAKEGKHAVLEIAS